MLRYGPCHLVKPAPAGCSSHGRLLHLIWPNVLNKASAHDSSIAVVEDDEQV